MAGQAYSSFPSGHMAAVCAVISVFWISYRHLRVIYLTIVLGRPGRLGRADFHFLSDCIAGAFLGASIGLMASNLSASIQQTKQGLP
jgi:hypothetical protein